MLFEALQEGGDPKLDEVSVLGRAGRPVGTWYRSRVFLYPVL